MIVLGLTGSIGMGKSTIAAMFEGEGVPVFDADAAVHRLYSGRAAPLVEARFPGTVADGKVDRETLSRCVLGDAGALKDLEAIVHPLVRDERTAFLTLNRDAATSVVVLDIPLLYETGSDTLVDKVVLVSAPEAVQKARVLARAGMTPDRFAAILAKQMPDAEKRRRADIIIETGDDLESARRQVRAVLGTLGSQEP
jgi:dephospho-CoA kinase